MRFNVLAVDPRQQVVALTLEAASETLAADQVRVRGLHLISLECKSIRLALPQRKSKFATTLFSMELLSLLQAGLRSEEHTSELQSQSNLVCRLLLEKKKK